MYVQALFIIFLVCIAVQLGFVLYFFTHVFSLSQKVSRYTPHIPVSVIICARNEAENLQQHLPAILGQRYTNALGNSIFEVIVVNDGSDDHTRTVLNHLEGIYSNLKVVTVPNNEPRKYPGKKHALSKGVDAAANDVLVMIDADCAPASAVWLHHMARPFHEGKEIVAGYGQYRHESTLLNAFIRWETVHTFLQLSSYARTGRGYMAVGRNMGCTKGAFMKAQQSPDWGKLPSGDDDLLVRAAGTRYNVGVVAHPMAFTTTAAKNDWNAWAKQKRRHLSTGKYYRFYIKALLAKYGVSHALSWICFFALLFTPMWGEALSVMLLRSAIYWMVWQRGACVLREKKLIRFFPLFDFGWMVYNFAFLPYITWKNKQQWT